MVVVASSKDYRSKESYAAQASIHGSKVVGVISSLSKPVSAWYRGKLVHGLRARNIARLIRIGGNYSLESVTAVVDFQCKWW